MIVRRALLLATLLLCMAAAQASAAAPGPPVNGITPLSDERNVTWWAHPVAPGTIRALPENRARPVGRIHWLTEDGLPEVYVALAQVQAPDGTPWVQIRVPTRPNGVIGWVPRDDLSAWHVDDTFLLIDRQKLRATLFRGPKVIWSSEVGVGKPSTPTPAGHFYVRERIANLKGSPVYGPFAFGTSAYSSLSDWPHGGVVGIHGTDEPRLLPGRVSHGCVRMPNAKVIQLARLMPVGTPVQIT